MRRILKRLGAVVGRLYFKKCLVPLHRRPERVSEFPISVHMLTSARFVLESIMAIQSFEHVTQRRWKVVFHDDGCLSQADCQPVEKVFS